MTTFFRDFHSDRIEDAWRYASGQSSLGHNVRLMSDDVRYRVFFSAVQVDPENAINVKDVPKP